VLDAGAKVLVDERDLWPDGKFPTTVLIVRTQYLAEHPQTVQSFLRGLLASIDWANGNKVEAQAVANEALKKLTGKALSQPVIERAFANITLSLDPLAATFPQLAKDAVTTGSSKSTPDLKGLVDLGLLNGMLTAVGKPTVDAAGLDKK
jgi:NitT/TauT family transport system substrate-binding protein